LIAWFISGAMPLLAVLAMPAAGAADAKHHDVIRKAAPQPVVLDDEDVTIEMSLPQGFTPPSVEIKTGTTVTWHNAEAIDYPVVRGYHKVVADDGSFESPDVAPGARWSFTFLKPGTYTYHCGIHPTMTGTIIVTGKPVKNEPKEARVEIVEPDPNDQNSWGYKPADIEVEVGTTVTWVNNGAQTHTVTDDDDAFDSGDMAPGDKFTFTFKKAGVYNYNCTPHPWMKGTVSVHEPGKAPPKEEPEEDDEGSSAPPTSPSNPSSTGGSGPQTFQVNIVEGGSTSDWGYDPSSIEVGVGDTVTWTNTGSVDHTVTSDDGSFDSGSIAPGGTWSYTFEEVGEYQYHCDPHPFMVASVSVVENPTGSGGATTGSAAGPTVEGSEMPGMSTTTQDPIAAEDEAAQDIAATPTSSLSGKEASLGAIASLLAASLAFLVGQWWGFNVRRPRTSGAAA
jgi:plastocyanin